MKTPIEDLVRWGAYLARLSSQPRTFKVLPGSDKFNKDQENARRRQFQILHLIAIGGEPIWEHHPLNPRRLPDPRTGR